MFTQISDIYVLDRREGNIYILIGPDGEHNTTELPDDAREGDVFHLTADGFVHAPEETKARKERIEAKMNRLFKKRD